MGRASVALYCSGIVMSAILLVEDDPDIREEAAEALREEGYRVITAANGEEALERAAEAGPLCLILLDLMMPVMDGWDCRKRLLKDPRLASVPVVIFSGAGSVHEEKELLRAAGVILKPSRL